jgi:putative FmdB family regulatory protein
VPIYDYVCSSCSTRTEVIHGIDAPTPRFCPACGAEDTLRKVFVPPAVHFKGSGWAKKDRSSSSSSRTRASASGTSGSSGGDGARDGGKDAGKDGGSAGETSSSGTSGGKDGGDSKSDGSSQSTGGASTPAGES